MNCGREIIYSSVNRRKTLTRATKNKNKKNNTGYAPFSDSVYTSWEEYPENITSGWENNRKTIQKSENSYYNMIFTLLICFILSPFMYLLYMIISS